MIYINMKNTKRLLTFVIVLFCCGLFSIDTASAAKGVYYVDPLGTDDGSHGTATGTDAWKSIQYAISNASNPTTDTVIINISADTFTTSNDDISIDRNFTDLTLQGAGANTTIIQSHSDPDSSTTRVFTVGSGETVSFEDLTIQNGKTSTTGAAIYFGAGGLLTIQDSIIYNNDGESDNDSGGVYSGSDVVIERSTFYDNNSDYVGALYASGTNLTAQITNSTFFENTGNQATIFLNDVELTLTNSLIANGNSLTLLGNEDHYFKNSVVIGSESEYDIEYSSFSGSVVDNGNNIIGLEEEDDGSQYFADGVNGTSVVGTDGTLSDLSIKSAVSENNSTNGTLTCAVTAGSDVINTGDSTANNGVSIPSTDQRGKSRVNTIDIGPFEYQDTDEADPVISSLSPADGSEGVATDTNLVMTFDESVSVNSGNIYLTDSHGAVIETIDVTAGNVTETSSTVITVNPGVTLSNNTEYYIQIDAGAVVDDVNNEFHGIFDKTTWNFTTDDGAAPYITSLSPADDATKQAIDANLVMTFNQYVDAKSGYVTLFTSDGTQVEQFDVTSDISGTGTDTITVNPTENLQTETSYYVQVDATAFDDGAGFSYAGISDDTTWNFTTSDTTAITVSSITGSTSEAGGTATFTVVLNAEPTSDVSIPVSSSDTTEGTVSPSELTFTSANWSTEQTVTVTGVDDEEDDGNIVYPIVLGAAISSDSNYNGIDPDDVAVTNLDNDGTPEPDESAPDADSDGIPDTTEELDPNDESDVEGILESVVGSTKGNITVSYTDAREVDINVFANDTSTKKTKVKQIGKTGFYVVVKSSGNKMATMNVLTGDKKGTKKLSKKKWKKKQVVKVKKLRKKRYAIIATQNAKKKGRLSVVRLKANGAIGKKISKRFKVKKGTIKKVVVKKNKLTVRTKKKKVVRYLFTKKKKLKKK